jgi:hypothetical protein
VNHLPVQAVVNLQAVIHPHRHRVVILLAVPAAAVHQDPVKVLQVILHLHLQAAVKVHPVHLHHHLIASPVIAQAAVLHFLHPVHQAQASQVQVPVLHLQNHFQVIHHHLNPAAVCQAAVQVQV